jgi:hypothetical protein
VSAIWDGDTGTVTITCTKDGAPVNLTGATLTIITKAKEGGAVVNLAEVPASSNLANGVVAANGQPLGVGTYELVVRAVAGGITATYPSADKMPEVLFVRANLDAA